MRKLIPILLTGVLISFSACKSANVNPTSYQSKKIIFGEGGGFSGFVNTYCILDNGMTFKKMHRDTGFVYVTTLDKNQAQQTINNFSMLGFDKLTLNDPGNAYNFLEFEDGENKNRLVWDPHNVDGYKSLSNYYSTIRVLFFENNKLIK